MAYYTLSSLNKMLLFCNSQHPRKVNYSLVVYYKYSEKLKRMTRKYKLARWVTLRHKENHKVVKQTIKSDEVDTCSILALIEYLTKEYQKLKGG